MRNLIIGFTLLILASGCSGDKKKSPGSLPESIGGEYGITVVVDRETIDKPHVLALQNALQRPYPMLNQPEPWFKLTWYNADEINKYTLKSRYVILLSSCEPGNKVSSIAGDIFGEKANNMPDVNGKFYLTGSHAFANPQSIMYLSHNSIDELAESIDDYADAILKYFEDKESKRISDGLFEYRRKTNLEAAIKNEVRAGMLIPTVYEAAVLPFNDDNLRVIYDRIGIDAFKWLYSDARHSFSNIAVWSMPYTDSSQLKLANLIEVRDSVLKYFIPCEDEGSYMGTETRYEEYYPSIKQIELNGNYAYEIKGLWAAVKGFQGGPFIQYVVVDEENGRLVFADGSVAAKGQDKKKYMVRIKAILSTLKL